MSAAFPFLLVMSLATISDFATKRISNYLILLGLSVGLLMAYINGGIGALGGSLLGMIVGLLVFIYPYMKLFIGAGDVKLMMVSGSFLGPYFVLLAVPCIPPLLEA